MVEMNLGSCCICEGTKDVRNVFTLDKKSPTPGRGGWGCFVCNLPAEGAVAVICDECFDRITEDESIEFKFACVGYPGEGKRIPYSELTGEHKHDMAFHPEEGITLIENEKSF